MVRHSVSRLVSAVFSGFDGRLNSFGAGESKTLSGVALAFAWAGSGRPRDNRSRRTQ